MRSDVISFTLLLWAFGQMYYFGMLDFKARYRKSSNRHPGGLFGFWIFHGGFLEGEGGFKFFW